MNAIKGTRLWWVAALLLLMVFVAPADAKRKKKVVVPPAPPTQEQRIGAEAARKYQYFYIEALRQQGLEKYDAALELFNHCIQIDEEASEAHFSIARYYTALGDFDKGKEHYERAVALEPQNTEFLEELGEFYLKSNEIDAATDLYERVSKQYPDRSELLEVLMSIYQYQKNYQMMLTTLERIETVEGTNEQITLSKMQILSQLGRDDEAYEALTSLCKAHPNDLNYQVMAGNWALSHDRKDEAFKTFRKVLDEEPDHAQAQMSMMDYYRAEGNTDEADALLYKMLENPKTESQTRITLMRQVIRHNEQSGGDSTRILGIFRHVLQLPQKTNDMAMMQVAYMEYAKMPTDSIRNALLKVLEITPEETSARLKYIGILWEDSIGTNVIEECKKAIDYTPEETSLYYYLGLAQYLNNNDAESLAALRGGIARITSDTPNTLSASMYMISGDILHKMGRAEEAYVAYDSCLVYNPDEISCLNNYAYYLSEENKELKKAEQMSYRTIVAEPRNGTYLDTYAWILYQQERYEEARIYIDQTLRADSLSHSEQGDSAIHSATILEHAGDIYMKVGNRKRALELYEEALRLEPENAEDIRKRMKAK